LGNKLKEDIPFFKRTPYIVNNGITVINAVSSREKPSYKDGIVRILFLSNFDKTKGVIELLEGAKLLKNSGLNFKMQFIGQFYGQFTKNFFDDFLKTHDLSEKIEVIGPVYGNAKNPYFINNDIFVFPTKNDALPLVLLEAMQFGLPCISTFEGSIPDVIEDNVTGLLCKQRDVEDLANKIELLIRNKALREQMGKRGKERFDKLFTLERFEQNLCETFTKILKK
jgi:glycosyltransferase involved in cell wall biosynthesis